jgi:hypothetical protein
MRNDFYKSAHFRRAMGAILIKFGLAPTIDMILINWPDWVIWFTDK